LHTSPQSADDSRYFDEFSGPSSLKTFGDVGHNRNSSSPDLILPAKVSREAAFGSYSVNFCGECSRFPPRD
jgi:hypothetical protein